MNTKRDHLASLRVNTEAWTTFQEIAKKHRMSASLALITLIDLVNEGKISLAGDLPVVGEDKAISNDLQSIVKEEIAASEVIASLTERLTKLENNCNVQPSVRKVQPRGRK